MRSVKVALVSGAALAGIGAVCAGATAALVVKGLIKTASQRLRGKVVVITGGSRGLGLALAEEFGRRGAKLVLAARSETELSLARQQLLDRNAIRSADDVLISAVDLRKIEDAERLIEEATRRFGLVDVLINNAGVITVG